MATTGQQVADFVRGQVLEPVAGFWTNAELLAAINAAEADFFGWVAGKDGVIDASTQAGKQILPLPGNVTAIKKVFYNDVNADGTDNWVELEMTTLEKITQENPNWLSDATTARGTPARVMLYEDSLYLHPVPDTTGREVKAFVTTGPDPLESLSDYLNVDDSLVDGIKSYVLWQMWQKDKEAERAALEEAKYKAYLGKGRRFYKRRMGGLRRRMDVDAGSGFNRLSGE